MNFNKHLELRGSHALFSPSQPSWLNYDEEQIEARVRNQYRTVLGTELHEFVASQIMLGHKVTNVRQIIQGIESYIFTKYKCQEDSKLAVYGMTLLHELKNVPKEAFDTARIYINDGIGFRMSVEQPLVYSEFIYGTADTISFRDNFLRIHDYKSGDRAAKMEQLMGYAALFCLEYVIKPRDIEMELRIYQAGEVVTCNPEVGEIEDICDKIIFTDKYATKFKSKEE